ncbi:peptidase family M13, partial [Ostertagia ostertagi]
MINNIGYPDITNDISKLDEQYKELVILPEDTYYSLMKKAVVWMQKKEFRKLLKPFDRHEFDVSPAVVNAFYSPEKNAITFPAGILQPPFFSGSFPKAVNYGAIGAVIGHEITHGFDDQGSQYDKDGNLHNWWSTRSLEAFDERRRCIVEQYGNYTVPKTTYKVNGKLTQGENIADNGGVKEALKAYKKYVATKGEEARLPGLQHYTNTQIFFLSYAHFWCGQKKEAAAMQQVTTDEHSPEIFRVTGVLSNLREFAEAFSCPAG